jgi:hypothetical protein
VRQGALEERFARGRYKEDSLLVSRNRITGT